MWVEQLEKRVKGRKTETVRKRWKVKRKACKRVKVRVYASEKERERGRESYHFR